jgi:hypothetical protein
MNVIRMIAAIFLIVAIAACDRSKPKAVSNNITKTSVTVDGKKDSVINNPEKNYGNATVSEPCVKCLIDVIQQSKNYKAVTSASEAANIAYNVNWITSSKPVSIGSGRIVNGMAVDVNLKDDGNSKKLTTFLYNNEDAKIYFLNAKNNYDIDSKVDSFSLKRIRNNCFWGVASSK